MAGNQVRIGVSAPGAKQTTGEIKGVRDAFDRLQKQGTKGFGIGVGAAVTTKAFSMLDTAATAVVGSIGDAIQAGSDLNETVSKSRVIFGSGSKAIEEWSDTAADSFGQSKRAALDAASGFAGLFSTAGIELGKATDMSQELTELGSDLASFFNTDVDQALQALKSGLSGESEPLRKFNVFLSETAVSAKLAQMGVKKVGGQFTESQKQTARYKIILEQTSAAQGDFARTADGLANSEKKLQARLEDLSAELGQKLVPVQTAVVQGAVDLLDVLGILGDDMAGRITPEVIAFRIAVGAITEEEGRAQLATLKLQDAVKHMADATKDDLIPTLGDTETATGDLADENRDLRSTYVRLKDAIGGVEGALDTLGDELYGSTILAGDLAQAQKDLNEKIEEGPDSKNAADVAIYKGEVAKLKVEVFLLQAQMAQAAGPQAFYDWLVAQEGALGKTDAKVLALIANLKLLQQVAGAGPIAPDVGAGGGTAARSSRQQARATGGPVSEGVPVTVGEFGKETFVPKTDGTIIPHGRTPSTGNTTIFNLTFTGRVGDTKEDIVAALLQAARFDRG